MTSANSVYLIDLSNETKKKCWTAGSKTTSKKIETQNMAPPTSKRRRPGQVEEISFDFDARSEYLTGFHKRKLHRIKVAQQENAKKDRDLRIESRKNVSLIMASTPSG